MSMFNERNDPNEDGFRRYQKQLALEEWDSQSVNYSSGSSGTGGKVLLGVIGAFSWGYLTQIVAALIHRIIQTNFTSADWTNFLHSWTHISWLVFATISCLIVFGFFCSIRLSNAARITFATISSIFITAMISIFGVLVWMLVS